MADRKDVPFLLSPENYFPLDIAQFFDQETLSCTIKGKKEELKEKKKNPKIQQKHKDV